jgi:branched-chain amino acid transport system substrate-binding protein
VRYRSGGLIAVATASSVALVLAGCSSSSKGSSTTPASSGSASSSSPASSSAPVKVQTIKVEGIGDLTQFADADKGAAARIKRFNDTHEIPGTTIDDLGMINDSGNSDQNLAAVRRVTQQDKVAAVVPMVPTGLLPAGANLLKQQKVPYVGFGYVTSMCNNDYGFGFNGCNVPGVTKTPSDSLIKLLQPALGGKTFQGLKIAIQGQSQVGGSAYSDAISAAAKKLGADVVFNKSDVPTGASNVQPFVDAVLASHPDLIINVTDFLNTVKLEGTYRASGYKGLLANYATYVPGLLQSSKDLAKALEGVYMLSTAGPSEFDTNPYATQMNADFKAAGTKLDFGSEVGYLSADWYIAALKNAGDDPSKVVEKANAGFDYHPDGGMPISFPGGHDHSAQCGVLLTVQNGAYKMVKPWTCL